jgi:hypothetical protein
MLLVLGVYTVRLLQISAENANGYTTIRFIRKLNTGNKNDVQVSLTTPTPLVFAWGSKKSVSFHDGGKDSASVDLTGALQYQFSNVR